MDTALVGGLLAIATSIVTLITVIIRATQSIERLRHLISDQEDSTLRVESELKHEIEKLQLTVNGVRERMEHINTRVSGQLKESGALLKDVEIFLAKTTSFERRRSGE